MDRAAELFTHQQAAEVCKSCRLCQTRTKVVYGEGNPNTDLMFIGEGPGRDEDLSGRPFVGLAGQLLDQIIGAVQISRESVYIANMVKCRPPNNRNPEPDEVAACRPWLDQQLSIIRPKVIVTLGNVPTQYLMNIRQGITRTRGNWYDFHHSSGFTAHLMPIYHPAFLLRNPTRQVGGPKSLTWRDIKEVKATLDRFRQGEMEAAAPAAEEDQGRLF
ncbi:uracil-DNA glycosylase [Deinococcus cellulosilyticus]|uniref:Type-4 uracil-DNA glycosylase n=1 Tax=Deinococcus cellulosilyticus (strain DSM 18568 / NBRC 106333 / KACC 11606 / 5516J-15) TaxID=1223518 RepID=A0A511NAN0_DEIC1|nr:uracil-DNA glycosylase [Deinococcus cellulosilyticus]GEM49879.1 uracil-DNA glycosylase [Deinococcus cellulosilyticus NBRC 106333 = KACC 11606]